MGPICSSQKLIANRFFIETQQELPRNLEVIEKICRQDQIKTYNQFINNKNIKAQLDDQQKEIFKNKAEEETRQKEHDDLIQKDEDLKTYKEKRKFDEKYFIKRTDNIYQLNNDKLLDYPEPDYLQRYIVFGLQDSGKTTFINNLINVFHGIKYLNRFRIVAEYRKTHYDEGVLRYRTFRKDDHDKVHFLEIIDTPSYLEKEDYIEGSYFTQKIASFLHRYDIQGMNMIFFVKKYQNKQKAIELDKFHQYIVNQIYRLFGENYLHYLKIILTFSTEQERLNATQSSSQFLGRTYQLNNNSLKFNNGDIEFRNMLSKYDYDWYKQIESFYESLQQDNNNIDNKQIQSISEAQYIRFKDLDVTKADLGRQIYNMIINSFIDSHNYKSALQLETEFKDKPLLDGNSFLKYDLFFAEIDGQKEKFYYYKIESISLEDFLKNSDVDLEWQQENEIRNQHYEQQEIGQEVVTVHYDQFKLARTNSNISRDIMKIKFTRLLDMLLCRYQANMGYLYTLIEEYLDVCRQIQESSVNQSNAFKFQDVIKKYVDLISNQHRPHQEQFIEIGKQQEQYQQNRVPFVPK